MTSKTVPLSEICTGGGSYGIAASAVEYSPDLPTYLRITDINDDGTLNESGFKSVNDPNSAKYYLSPNDIVFARTGASTGRNYFYDGSDGEFVYAGFLIKFSLDPQKVNPLFVKYYCQSKDYYDWVGSFNTGSTRGNINAQTLGNMPVPVLPRGQQDLITDTLSTLDARIAENRKINHHLEQMVHAIFKSWFVDFKPFDGEQPTTWVIGKAEDFFDIAIGKTPPRKEPEWFTTNPQDVIWASISDMGSCGMFISDSSEYLTAESVERFNIKVVPSGTVLLSFKLTVGRVAITDGEMTTNEAIAHFKQSSKITLEYLYCYLKAFDYQSLGNTSSIATAVNSKTIKAMPFVMPDEKALADFHAATAPLFEQVRVNLAENARLAALRDALLPRLMSGELSVVDQGDTK